MVKILDWINRLYDNWFNSETQPSSNQEIIIPGSYPILEEDKIEDNE